MTVRIVCRRTEQEVEGGGAATGQTYRSEQGWGLPEQSYSASGQKCHEELGHSRRARDEATGLTYAGIDKKFSSSPKRRHRLWDPSGFANSLPGCKSGRDVDHSSLYSAEGKNGLRYARALRICLRGVYRDTLSFSLISEQASTAVIMSCPFKTSDARWKNLKCVFSHSVSTRTAEEQAASTFMLHDMDG